MGKYVCLSVIFRKQRKAAVILKVCVFLSSSPISLSGRVKTPCAPSVPSEQVRHCELKTAGTLTGSERPTVTVQHAHTKDPGSGSAPQAAHLGWPGSRVELPYTSLLFFWVIAWSLNWR